MWDYSFCVLCELRRRLTIRALGQQDATLYPQTRSPAAQQPPQPRSPAAVIYVGQETPVQVIMNLGSFGGRLRRLDSSHPTLLLALFISTLLGTNKLAPGMENKTMSSEID